MLGMNPGFLFSVLAIIAIIVASSFGLHIFPTAPIHILPDSVADAALFVCPAASETFDEIARQLSFARNSLTIVFFFVAHHNLMPVLITNFCMPWLGVPSKCWYTPHITPTPSMVCI